MPFDKSQEVILKPSLNRYTLFPIKYKDIWELYKTSIGCFWTVDEINFSEDLNDWNNKLNDNERWFIKNVLSFFANADMIVNENLAINFYNEIQVPEIRQLYSVQIFIESIHAEAYSLMIDTYITDTEERDKLFNAIEHVPSVKKKAEWALKYINSDEATFPEKLIAFICIEGIFFSGSFCAIYWLKSRNLMKNGLGLSNEFISRDEALHCRTGILIYSKLQQKLPEEKVHEIFREAIEYEKEFITASLPCSLIGMNETLMKQYICYVGDYWLSKLGYSKLYNVENPFPFMEYISLENKTNFFESTVSSYQNASIALNKNNTNNDFTTNEDF